MLNFFQKWWKRIVAIAVIAVAVIAAFNDIWDLRLLTFALVTSETSWQNAVRSTGYNEGEAILILADDVSTVDLRVRQTIAESVLA